MRRTLLHVALPLAVGLALGWLVLPDLFFERVDPPLSFSHAVHTGEDVGLDCASCHGLDETRAITLPTLETCAACHSEMLGDSPQERVLVDEYVAAGREVDWPVHARQPEGVRFSHAQHVVLAELECGACHGDYGQLAATPPLFVNRLSGYPRALWGRGGIGPSPASFASLEMNDCVDCHRDRQVVQSCLDCHR